MVFENITLFEIRLDDSQFGRRSLGRNAADEPVDESADDGRDRGPLAALVVLALFTVGAGLIWRRFRSDDELDVAATDEVEADLTTAE